METGRLATTGTTILGRALSSDDGEARQLAIEVVHRLGAQGEDYRDVLGKAHYI